MKERLVRTAFWTLWVLTLTILSGARSAEVINNPQGSMSVEARTLDILSCFAVAGLVLVSLLVGHWSRWLRRLGWVAVAFWLVYMAWPRF